MIGAMEEKEFKTGESVIEQGADGDCMYIVDFGELDCFKQFNPSEQPKFLKTYVPGEAFG